MNEKQQSSTVQYVGGQVFTASIRAVLLDLSEYVKLDIWMKWIGILLCIKVPNVPISTVHKMYLHGEPMAEVH